MNEPFPRPDAAARSPTRWGPAGDLAVLRFDGADAASFLQGQLSSDVRLLAPGTLQRSSYNSAKGRMLANLVLVRPADEADGAFRAVVAADLAESLAKRLAMFVLRAKVSVRSLAGERALLGVSGGVRPASAVDLAVAPGEAVRAGDALVLGLPDGRLLVDASPDDAAISARLSHGAARVDAAAWPRARIEAGVPLVTAATSDQFVPQALNWDALSGISFQKGCYPGQEIVARMQYLGRLKERLFLFRCDATPSAAGTRTYSAVFGEQPCGAVVNAAADGPAGSVLLAVVQRSAVDAGDLRLGGIDGPVLALQPLPYPVPEPAPPRERIA